MHPNLGTAFRIYTKRLPFLILIMVALFLAACSGGANPTAAPESTQEEAVMTEEVMEPTEEWMELETT